MEKIVILSFVFLACVVLKTSAQATTPVPLPMTSSMTQAVNSSMPEMLSSAAAGNNTTEAPSTDGPNGAMPTSGAVNLKTLAGFVASFALIALF